MYVRFHPTRELDELMAMRILIALTYYRPHYSGLTIYTERQARALVERGHQVTILTSRFDPALPHREVMHGVEVVRPRVWFRLSKGVIMPGMPYWSWKLARQADIVQLHVPQLDAAPISMIARLLGKPVVLTYHCDLQLPEGLIHNIANRASDLANHITAANSDVIVQNTRDYSLHSPFLRRYLKKVRPVYPPVQIAQVSKQERDAFREKFNIQPGQRLIGMAARLATEKGAEYLACAMPKILEAHPEARVLFVGPYQDIVGEEAYAQKVKALIEPLKDRWTFLGIVSPAEMGVFFQECEVTVLPSINSTESYGIVQVESMTCGTPVVASNLPGVRVPVFETGMGQVVPLADADRLAEAIIDILDQPGNYRGQPEKIVSLSTPEAVAQEYENIYKELLSPHPLPSIDEVEFHTNPADSKCRQ